MEVGIDTKTIAGHASRGGWGGAVGDRWANTRLQHMSGALTLRNGSSELLGVLMAVKEPELGGEGGGDRWCEGWIGALRWVTMEGRLKGGEGSHVPSSEGPGLGAHRHRARPTPVLV